MAEERVNFVAWGLATMVNFLAPEVNTQGNLC